MYGSSETMNFQPKFDSGAPVADLLPSPRSRAEPAERAARILILRLSLIGFITALVARAIDPIIPPIAHESMSIRIAVALLTTAFALPFALVQPVLGPVADMVGKVRVMIVCLAVLIGAMLVSAFATDFTVLLGARIVAGIAAGGIFPVGIAVIGDLVPIKERQVAIGRWLTAVITGNLLGASLAGVIGDLVGWRAVFFVFPPAWRDRADRGRDRHAARGGARPRHALRACAAFAGGYATVFATRARKSASRRCSPRAS